MIPLEIQLETEPQLVDGPTRLSPSHSTTNPPGQHLSARPLNIIPFVGWILALLCYVSLTWDKVRQGWHDKAAATLVVKV